MTVFNSSFELPRACYSRGEPGRKYCQLTGDYEMHLDVNQWKPYQHYGVSFVFVVSTKIAYLRRNVHHWIQSIFDQQVADSEITC